MPNKYVESILLADLDIEEDLHYRLAQVVWSDLIDMNEPSYATLTYEFLSSFTITSEGLLSFRIANQYHQIMKEKLAIMFNWKLVEQQQLLEKFATPFWLKITCLPTTEDMWLKMLLLQKS